MKHHLGEKSFELTILPDLFLDNPKIEKWKIDFNVLTSSYMGGTSFGLSSIIIGINQRPTVHSCTIEPKNGMTDTNFNITCNELNDSDGYIEKIEYYSI